MSIKEQIVTELFALYGKTPAALQVAKYLVEEQISLRTNVTTYPPATIDLHVTKCWRS